MSQTVLGVFAGVVLWELFTLDEPWQDKTPMQVLGLFLVESTECASPMFGRILALASYLIRTGGMGLLLLWIKKSLDVDALLCDLVWYACLKS